MKLQTSAKILALLVACTLSSPAQAAGISAIVVYGGIPRADGLGDIAASFQMAKYVHEVFGDAQVYLLVDDRAHEYLTMPFETDAVRPLNETYPLLAAPYKRGRDFVHPSGVHIVSTSRVPQADLYLGFSLGPQGADVVFEIFKNRPSGVALIYDEPREQYPYRRYEVREGSSMLRAAGYENLPEKGLANAFLGAGIGDEAMGFYLRPVKPLPPLDRQQTLQHLKARGGLLSRMTSPFKKDKGDLLAFSYVQGHTPKRALTETQLYVDQLSQVAEQAQYRDKKIVVVTRKVAGLKAPANTQVISARARAPADTRKSYRALGFCGSSHGRHVDGTGDGL